MRNSTVILLALFGLLALFASPATAQTATKASVTVIHGVPGLPKPVDVFANSTKLFSFAYGESQGPLMLDKGTYTLEVKLDNKVILGPAKATVEAGKNYSIIAHLTEKGDPTLSIYGNDISPLATGKSRLTVRHNAAAPAVDVRLKRWFWTVATFKNLVNPKEVSADVNRGTYYAYLYPAGQRKAVFGPAKLALMEGKSYIVYAIGKLGEKSFQLFVQVIDIQSAPLPGLTAMVKGKSCGGAIGVSTKTPAFGKEFKVTLSGAAKEAFGIMHIGGSDNRFFFLRLPFDLRWLGAPGCSLYTSIENVRVFKTDKMGDNAQAFTIPAGMARYFKGVYFQFGFANGGKNRLGLSFTDYLAVTKK